MRDTAIITNADGTRVGGANQVPAPAGAGTMNPDGAYRVGNGVSQPSVLTHVAPSNSEVGEKLRVVGFVRLSIVVQPDGTVSDVQVVKSLGFGLDEKAIAAVQK
jgi:periplasmic protein TonB